MLVTPGVYDVEFCEGVCGRGFLDGTNVEAGAPSESADPEIPHVPVGSKEEVGARHSLLLWLVPGVEGLGSGGDIG